MHACYRGGQSHSGICLASASPNTLHTAGKFSPTSKKESVICFCYTEAELYAAMEATKDIIFLRNILAELG